MMKFRPNPLEIQFRKRTERQWVAVLFLCLISICNGASNWVDGITYGTNYSSLATASSIESTVNGNGSLVIGYDGTTNLTLSHNISGFISITNQAAAFTINAVGSSVSNSQGFVFSAANATNLSLSGGQFIGTTGTDSGFPPLPPGFEFEGLTTSAIGGLLLNSTATISGTEFAGSGANDGLYMEQSVIVISNGIFRGGTTGAGLFSKDNSIITIHDGSFTGGVGNTAFFLQDSSTTIYDGTFTGNINGSTEVAGEGLFSILTESTTNQVSLYGGDFSSVAFYGTTGSVQRFLAGTNLTIQGGIIQSEGTLAIENLGNDALDDIMVFNGTLQMSNAFTLASDGEFSMIGLDSVANFSDLSIESNATVSVGTGMLTADALAVLPSGNLSFLIYEGTNGIVTATTADFGSNSMIRVDASISGLTAGTSTNQLISTSGGISFTGVASNHVETTVSGRSELKTVITDSNNLSLLFTTAALRDYWNADGPLGELADDLDLINNTKMMTLIDAIDNPSISGAAVEQTYFTTRNTFQTALNGLDAAVGQSTSRGTEFREQLNLPSGAKGPEINNDLRGWAKYYGQYYSHDAVGMDPEYEATLHGGAVGIDKSFGNLLLGISGGAGRALTQLDNDGEEDINSYHGAIYGTYGAQRLYLDGGIAYGHNRVKSTTAKPFVLNGKFDADMITAYLGGGFNLIDTKGGAIITPEVSVQYSMYQQEDYTETSTDAVPRSFDEFDADSLRSKLGINLAMLNTKVFETVAFKVEGRFHWLHEFNPDPGTLNFQLEGGSGSYQITYPLLDEEMFRAGVSMTFFNTLRNSPKNILFRLDFDEFFGQDFNSHNIAAKAVYAF